MDRRASPTASAAPQRGLDMSDVRIIVFVVSLLVLFLAATAQAALVYIDRARLKHMLEEGTPRASAVLRLLDEPTSSLGTILFISTLALCASAATGFWIGLEIWPSLPWLAVLLGIVQIVALLLVQFLGRVVAVSRPENVALTFV